MLSKCAIVFVVSFIFLGYLDAYTSSQGCPRPSIEHGRVRVRNRAKLVKFTCLYRYELVGNRYGSCMNGVWDVAMPVCVRPGCPALPPATNAVQLKSHKDAWVETFCLPGYKLMGSPTIYCDGYKWNGTAPTCVDEDTPSTNDASCDFEDPNLCGWMQDERHDFDWTRWNKNTPSFFLRTGPSFDHTLGVGRDGHYMYLEGTGVRVNKTACLLSPVIDSKTALDGCFSFYYHMYGRNMGGLRVYQKPDRLPLSELLELPEDERKQYILFEQWGDLGDYWLGAAPMLKDFKDDFQIVIEGVQGKSFANDIAFDDVAILRGQNCSIFNNAVATTPAISSSCQNRCNSAPESQECDCSPACELYSTCCEDYLELCVFNGNDGDDTSSIKPQTEKLISETTSTTTSTTSTTTTTTAPPPTTTPHPTTTKTTQSTTITPKTTRQPPTSARMPTPIITTKPTTKKITTTQPPTTTTQQTKVTTQKPTTVKLSTTTTVRRTTVVVNKMTTKDYKEIDKEKREEELQIQKIVADNHEEKTSSSLRTTMITIVILALIAVLGYFAVMSRTARGWATLARLRARVSRDPEVQFLSSQDDDL